MTTIEFDKKVECGPEFVAARILENCDELNVGGIWLPDTYQENGRLALCVIENLGYKAAEEYGIKVGDYIMIDRLSTFAHTAPVCVFRYNNVICLTDKDRSEFRPLRNMAFVEPDAKDDITDVGGICVVNYADKLRTGVVTAINCDEDLKLPYKTGDKVMLAKGGDVVQIGDRTIHIYKHDMLVCKILD